MIRILIVEDEKPIANLIRMSLKREGYLCDMAHDGMDAYDLLTEKTFDLVLLDVMLPSLNGFELMEYIRPMEIPVIFITAKTQVHDRVKGLRLGAEDYIIKPFEVIELIARVDVVLRRYHKKEDTLRCKDLVVHLKSHQVLLAGEEVSLTPKEFELAVLFLQNPNVALYRENIYEKIWQKPFDYKSKTVDLHIQRLRKKVHWEDMLRTVNKVGYRLEVS